MKVIKWMDLDKIKEQNNYYNNYYNTYNRFPCEGSILYEAEYDENYEDAIIKELVDNRYIICGDTHQYMYIPIFDNNTYIILSMRKWGEIMAEVMNLIKGLDKYTYKDFYLVSLCKKEEKLPIK